MYYENLVQPTDPKGSCRQNVVILVTDGAETCDETTAPNNTFVTTSTMTPPTDLCTGGGNYNPFHPVAQACLLRKAGIKVYVITDTTTGAANDTIAAAGGTGTALRVTLNDANAAKTAIVGIIASTVPPVEVCNGLDDNCNGQIDEGISNACRLCTAGNAIAACTGFVIAPDNMSDPDNQKGTGARHCAVEACNCQDDNCNGQVDEGLPPNACGQPCGCAVPTELCDGLDNDCDGDIDEGFMVGASCTNNGVGICRRGGILACRPDKMGTFCDAPTVPPQTEVCNGLDDNCNGARDEGADHVGCAPLFPDGDGDGFGDSQSAVACLCPQASGVSANNQDCHDASADVRPGQTAFFMAPRPGGGFDYDCNGIEQQQFSEMVECVFFDGECSGQGWAGSVPACGASGSFAQCNRANCGLIRSTRVQACR
jgi:hypothetical protein